MNLSYGDIEQGGSDDGGVAIPAVGVGEDGAEERQHGGDPGPNADALGRRRRAHLHHAGEVSHQVARHALVREPLHASHHCTHEQTNNSSALQA